MTPDSETTQLPLAVSVSFLDGVKYKVKKSIREFRYTPPIQVISNFLFWVNAGVVAGIFLLIQNKTQVINSGLGVVFMPSSKSNIPTFLAYSVKNLTVLPYIWYAMVVVWLVFSLLSMVTHSTGRYGMTSYILTISLILLLLMAKIILMPLLLIGG